MICQHGHDHSFAWCETDGCTKCHTTERSCDVSTFLRYNAADCQRTISDVNSGHLTGFTARAVAALVHLREAWIGADPSNRPGVELAIAALFATRSLAEKPHVYLEYLLHNLNDDQAKELGVAWMRRRDELREALHLPFGAS